MANTNKFTKRFIYLSEAARKGFIKIKEKNYFKSGDAAEQSKEQQRGQKKLCSSLLKMKFRLWKSEKLGNVLVGKHNNKKIFLLAADNAGEQFIESYNLQTQALI